MAMSTNATRQAMRDVADAARKCPTCGHANGWHSVDITVDPETFDIHGDTVSCKFEACNCKRPKNC